MSIKKTIKKFLKVENAEWFYSVRYSFGSIIYYVLRVFPIDTKKVVFSSFNGKYGGDPKALSDALHKCDETIQIVWLLDNNNYCKDEYVKCVKYESLRAKYELVTSKIWVDDMRKKGGVRKRNNQFYIGTGHGGIPMKKIEKDAEDKLTAMYVVAAKNDSKMTDLKPSNSQWRNDMLRRAFWYDGEILNCGLPRIERLIKERIRTRQSVKDQFGIDSNAKVFIYAPTFRNSDNADIYDIDFKRVKKALEKRFGETWIGLRRLHPNVKDFKCIDIPGVVIDTTNYPDMEDLIMTSDLLITDYSSCIFETFFLDIPAFIYAKDIEEYTEKERGLYWNIKELPFLLATNNDELEYKINRYDPQLYKKGLEALKKEIGFFDNQTDAIKRLVDRIIKEMDK